ncbi:MAG: hypothetical protein K2X93_07880 [Candidatus Obscuribacterales bacterium]|nr:hypothetical protein [Candidatus Obscuribacterales bacterium]
MGRVIIIGAALVCCMYCTFALPWAELNMDHTAVPHTLKLLHLEKFAEMLGSTYGSQKSVHSSSLERKKAEGKHGEYVYSFYIGLAMVAAAIAIIAAGADEKESEKLLLPQKQ